MLLGAAHGELELRAARNGARRLRGKFPYGRTAVLSDGGRQGKPRKEIIAPRAFGFRVKDPKANIHLLVGHDYNRPLASRAAGTLELTDTAEALSFEAEIAPELEAASWVEDFFAALAAGLILGISPGFRLPPARAVAKPETITQEPNNPAKGQHGATIRTVHEALLFELSAVSVPAYDETSIEEARAAIRSDTGPSIRDILNRWRV